MAGAEGDYIFGLHTVQEALAAGKVLDKVWIAAGASTPALNFLRQQLRQLEVPQQQVPLAKLEGLARGKTHQGVIAFLAQVVYQPLEQVLEHSFNHTATPLFVLLAGVTDVRNLGAIARTAECMGVTALVLAQQATARINADAMKTSAGALYHLPVCRENNLKKTLALLQAAGVSVVACTEKAEKTLPSTTLTGPVCLVIGDEGVGIPQELLSRADELVRIPLLGRVASLNVSVAAGMALYEVRRQRGWG